MADADDIVLEALLDDVLTPQLLERGRSTRRWRCCNGESADTGSRRSRQELAKVERERARFVAAIAAGGELPGARGRPQGTRAAPGGSVLGASSDHGAAASARRST